MIFLSGLDSTPLAKSLPVRDARCARGSHIFGLSSRLPKMIRRPPTAGARATSQSVVRARTPIWPVSGRPNRKATIGNHRVCPREKSGLDTDALSMGMLRASRQRCSRFVAMKRGRASSFSSLQVRRRQAVVRDEKPQHRLFRKRGGRIFVAWLGYDGGFSSRTETEEIGADVDSGEACAW